jgi:hypothetical protein
MNRIRWKSILIFILGMLAFALGWGLLTIFGGLRRPEPQGIVEDWGSICFSLNEFGGMNAAVSPLGCYSSTCTRPVLQAGTSVLDKDKYEIHIETRFVLAGASRFPLPCTEDCFGGGTLHFELGQLDVGDYEVWFKDQKVGDLMIFSGLPTPDQCFENHSG